ncbi:MULTISPECIES: hypothetical protein [Paraburkholderia]|uniref:hypothetical protein n=1 Tax=Paraburkholderia TaxID=1822464 RepID=UPI002252F3F6|nr:MULTISPECIES: hypothetical protein [Paraburkholderia]MCX4156148.1 hypothetical protein [Paraburkholderia aspalathi]MDN7165554.1 hypothetical protein [Paraburkholderia sp. SECH2]MDQ6394040.1 hypothetical protein [Paraburkholderia aspalathi]
MVKSKPEPTKQQPVASQSADKPAPAEPPEIDPKKVRATVQTSSTLRNAMAGQKYAEELFGAGNVDLFKNMDELQNRCDDVRDGDLTSLEETLTSQMTTLDLVFSNLAIRASKCDSKELMDFYFRHALKAQSQCVSTARAIGELKNPRQIAFVKQTNVANGPQQINNGSAQAEPVHAPGEPGTQSSQQLEHNNGERLEFGAAAKAGRGNQEMETVGAVHWADNERR